MIYPRLHLDKESRSLAELSNKSSRAVGLYRYAADLSTSIWMFSYRFEWAAGQYGPVLRWWRGEPLPYEVLAHIAAGLPVVAHNAAFERIMWNTVMPRQSGWGDMLPLMTIKQMDCTAARARAIGLPGDLERAAKVVNAPVQKNSAGSEYMRKMMKPRSVAFSSEACGHRYWAGTPATRVITDTFDRTELQIGDNPADVMYLTWWYDLNLRNGLANYCDDDILAECGVDVVVPALSDSERETWELDQVINDRGVMIDAPFVQGLIKLVETAVAKANRRMWTLTNGKVKKCTDHGAVRKWLAERNIKAHVIVDGELRESVGKGVTDELLENAGNDAVAREVIQLHNASSKSSTAKFNRALLAIAEDRRARGQFVYHQASQTARWAGQIIQLQNLVRIDEDRDLPTIRVIVDIVENFDTATAFEMIGVLGVVQ